MRNSVMSETSARLFTTTICPVSLHRGNFTLPCAPLPYATLSKAAKSEEGKHRNGAVWLSGRSPPTLQMLLLPPRHPFPPKHVWVPVGVAPLDPMGRQGTRWSHRWCRPLGSGRREVHVVALALEDTSLPCNRQHRSHKVRAGLHSWVPRREARRRSLPRWQRM